MSSAHRVAPLLARTAVGRRRLGVVLERADDVRADVELQAAKSARFGVGDDLVRREQGLEHALGRVVGGARDLALARRAGGPVLAAEREALRGQLEQWNQRTLYVEARARVERAPYMSERAMISQAMR